MAFQLGPYACLLGEQRIRLLNLRVLHSEYRDYFALHCRLQLVALRAF